MALPKLLRWLLVRFYPPIHFEQIVKGKFRKFGITIGGRKPCDIQVHDPRFFYKVAVNPIIGIEEAYVDGWWSPNNFPAFFNKLIIVSEWIHHVTEDDTDEEVPDHMDIKDWGCTWEAGRDVIENWLTMPFEDPATVEAWVQNLQKPKLQKQFGENFLRKRNFCMNRIAAGFRSRKMYYWGDVFEEGGGDKDRRESHHSLGSSRPSSVHFV